MARVLGVRAYVLLVLAALAWAFVQAAYAETPVSQYKINNVAVTTWYATAAAACNMGDAQAAATQESNPPTHSYTVNSVSFAAPSTCNEVYTDVHSGSTTSGITGYEVITSRQWCAVAGAAAVNGSCTATATCATLSGTSGGRYNFDTGTKTTAGSSGVGTPRYICRNTGTETSPVGCTLRLDGDYAYGGSAGTWEISGPTTYTGSSCNPSASGSGMGDGTAQGANAPTTSADTKTSNCPPGQAAGTVNGQTLCYTPGKDTPQDQKGTTTTSSTDASGTRTDVSKDSTTTCDANGKCTTTTNTTTTTTTSSGSSSTSTKTDTSTCTAGTPGCSSTAGGGGGGGGQQGSAFGGTCSAGFSCSGDAATCAIAQAAWQQKCALVDNQSVEWSNYSAAKAANSGVVAGSGFGTTTTVTISPANFDSSNALGVSAQCITDKSVVVAGTSVTLPFSQVCPYLGQLGVIMLGVAWLLAAVIVGKGVTA